jgi:hypothetical protein
MSGHALEPEVAAALVPLAPRPRRSLTSLMLALGVVVATAFGSAWGSVQLYYVLTDAWVAPLRVLPNSDVATELHELQQAQLAELARLDAEVARIDDQLAALDGVIATIAELEHAATGGRNPAELTVGLARATAASAGLLEQLAAGDDRADRLELELELERLEAEFVVGRARRSVAVARTAAQQTVLAELEIQPMFRAMRAATEIAFVPYEQLPGVRAGAHVVACVWRVFDCREVGRVTEVLPGEVAMQDPAGVLVRGQYVVLVLADRDASYARVLRVRS